MKLAVDENTSFDERRGEFMATARLEYLQDESGLYGISIPVLTYGGPRALTYALRPDRLDWKPRDMQNAGWCGAALQTVPKRIVGTSSYIEHSLVVALAEAIHARGGFVGDSRRGGYEWWADNKTDQERVNAAA